MNGHNLANEEIDPIGPVTSLVFETLNGSATMNLFDLTMSDVALEGSLVGKITVGDFVLATATVDGFSAEPAVTSATAAFVTEADASTNKGVFELSFTAVDGELGFDFETWGPSLSDDFGSTITASIKSEPGDDGQVIADGSATLTDSDTLDFSLTIYSDDALTINDYQIKFTEVTFGLSIDLGADDPWADFIETSGGATAQLKAEILLGAPFAGEGDDPAKLDIAFDFSAGDETFTASVSTDTVSVTAGDTGNISVTDLSLEVEFSTAGTFNLTKIKASGTASADFPSAEGSLSLVAEGDNAGLEIEDNTLSILKASGSFTAGGFKLEIPNCEYSADTSIVLAEAEIAIKQGDDEVFSCSGDLEYHTTNGLGEISFDASINYAPVSTPEPATLSVTLGDVWEISGLINISIENMGAAEVSATLGSSGSGDSAFTYFNGSIAFASSSAGIPLGPTGLSLTGGDVVVGYNMLVEKPEIDTTNIPVLPPSEGGFPEHVASVEQGQHALGGGVVIAAGSPDAVEMRAGMLIGFGSSSFAIDLDLQAWLGGGYVYGGSSISYDTSASEVEISLVGGALVPKATSTDDEDAGKYFSLAGTVTATVGGGESLSWSAEGTNELSVLRTLEGNVTWDLDDDGSGSVDGTLGLDESFELESQEFTAFGSGITLDEVNLSMDASGDCDVTIASWDVSEASGTLSAHGSASLSVSITVDLWFYEYNTDIDSSLEVGSEESPVSTTLGYTADPRKVSLSAESVTIKLKIGDLNDGNPKEFTVNGFSAELPLSL